MRGVSSGWHSIFCSPSLPLPFRTEEDEGGIFSPSRSLGTERHRRLFLLLSLFPSTLYAALQNRQTSVGGRALMLYSRIRSRRTRPWPSPLPPLPPLFRLRPAQKDGRRRRRRKGRGETPKIRSIEIKEGGGSGRKVFFCRLKGTEHCSPYTYISEGKKRLFFRQICWKRRVFQKEKGYAILYSFAWAKSGRLGEEIVPLPGITKPDHPLARLLCTYQLLDGGEGGGIKLKEGRGESALPKKIPPPLYS